MCNYTLASGSLSSLYNFSYQGSTMWPGFQVVPGTGSYFNQSGADRMYIANFDMIGAPYVDNPDSYYTAMAVEASECALWMCIQTYNTSVHSTKQQDEVVSVVDALEDPYALTRVSQADDPGNLTDFEVSELAVETLAMYLEKSFNGTAYFDGKSATLSSDMVAGIWNGTTSPQTWISNVATSMSNVMRSTNTCVRAQYDGAAYELGVTVHWAWISVPAVLVVSSTLLLIAVMIRTACSPVKPWKGSPLTLLLFDIDNKIREASYGQMDSHHGVEDAIGTSKVRLMRQPGKLWSLKAS
jgi:hypothetical protein